MYDLPQNNLSFLENNPIYMRNNFSSLKINELIKEINFFKKKYGIKTPEEDAILFYLTNHAIHVIKKNYSYTNQEIPKEVKDFAIKCNNISTRISKALFFHVSLVGHGMLWLPTLQQNQLDYFIANYGNGFGDFLKKKQNFDDLGKINMSIGQFLGGISSVFSFGKIIAWGKPYSNIINVIYKTSRGANSLHTAADHIWSLCHNGGTVLNKGIGGIYSVSSNYLFDILDVQDSGQIPQWLDNGSPNKKYINNEITSLTKEFKKLFPAEFTKVDNLKITESYQKRVKAHEAMKKQYSAWWNMNNNVNTNNTPTETVAKQPKINEILIDTFTKNKWI